MLTEGFLFSHTVYFDNIFRAGLNCICSIAGETIFSYPVYRNNVCLNSFTLIGCIWIVAFHLNPFFVDS